MIDDLLTPEMKCDVELAFARQRVIDAQRSVERAQRELEIVRSAARAAIPQLNRELDVTDAE